MILEGMTISFEEFINYLMKKWKRIAIGAALCALVFGGVTILFGSEIKVEPSDRYLYLKEQETALKEYMDNSVVMQMDSTNIFEKRLLLRNISDIELLKLYFSSGEVWENIKEGPHVKYLNEILIWNERENNIELTIRHGDEKKCDEYAEYIIEQIKKTDAKIEIVDGKITSVIDDTVLRTQLEKYDLLDDVQGELQYARAGYTLEVSGAMAAITGVFLGVFLSIIILFIKYLFIDKDKNQKEIEKSKNSDD